MLFDLGHTRSCGTGSLCLGTILPGSRRATRLGCVYLNQPWRPRAKQACPKRGRQPGLPCCCLQLSEELLYPNNLPLHTTPPWSSATHHRVWRPSMNACPESRMLTYFQMCPMNSKVGLEFIARGSLTHLRSSSGS